MNGAHEGAATVHLVTGEFPPQFGGVSDYTLSVASGLAAAGMAVHVWCPAAPEATLPPTPGVTVHRIAGRWGAEDFVRIDRELDAIPGPRRLIVHWVPHAYGRRSLNIGFCLWIRRRALKGDVVDLMVHEAFLAFGEGNWKQNVAAVVHRLMVVLLLSRANRVYVSIPAWASALRPYALWRRIAFEWLPVPSNIPRVDDVPGTAAVRRASASDDGVLVGHFGTYESHVRRSLAMLVPALLERDPSVTMLLMGRDSDVFRSILAASHPEVADRIHATGLLEPSRLSMALSACDLVVQPYPDGSSSRRGTLMAALAHGIPVVTTEGHLSEPLWRASGAVRIVRAADNRALLDATLDLCADAAERRRLGASGEALYAQRFDIANTIRGLLAESERLGFAADAISPVQP